MTKDSGVFNHSPLYIGPLPQNEDELDKGEKELLRKFNELIVNLKKFGIEILNFGKRRYEDSTKLEILFEFKKLLISVNTFFYKFETPPRLNTSLYVPSVQEGKYGKRIKSLSIHSSKLTAVSEFVKNHGYLLADQIIIEGTKILQVRDGADQRDLVDSSSVDVKKEIEEIVIDFDNALGRFLKQNQQ